MSLDAPLYAILNDKPSEREYDKILTESVLISLKGTYRRRFSIEEFDGCINIHTIPFLRKIGKRKLIARIDPGKLDIYEIESKYHKEIEEIAVFLRKEEITRENWRIIRD